MPTIKNVLLVLVCLVLAALVWLDNRPDPAAVTADVHPAKQRSDSKHAALPPEQPADVDGSSVPSAGVPRDATAPNEEAVGAEAPAGTAPAEGAPAAAEAEGSPPTGEPPSEYAKDESSINPLASIDLNVLNETVERPLVSPTRKRPPEPKAASGPAAPSEEEHPYELLGVAWSEKRAIAVMRKKKDGISFRVEEGDTLGRWQVSKVEPKSVHLVRADGEQEIVPLFRP